MINYSIDTLEAAIHFRSELILVLIVAFFASFSRRGREIEGFLVFGAWAEISGNIPPSMGTFMSLVCQYVPLWKILDRSAFGWKERRLIWRQSLLTTENVIFIDFKLLFARSWPFLPFCYSRCSMPAWGRYTCRLPRRRFQGQLHFFYSYCFTSRNLWMAQSNE